jgi:hypothetical protein
MNKNLHKLKDRMIASLGLGVILLLFCNAAWAQQVSGKVISDDGLAVPGVNVIIEGTTIGTTTDAEGAYTLNINNANAVLVFSFIGYTTERKPVQNQSVINVTLLPDIQTLSEVVVIGYGTQKKTSVTSAVSSISSDEVVSRQAPNTISSAAGPHTWSSNCAKLSVARCGKSGYQNPRSGNIQHNR